MASEKLLTALSRWHSSFLLIRPFKPPHAPRRTCATLMLGPRQTLAEFVSHNISFFKAKWQGYLAKYTSGVVDTTAPFLANDGVYNSTDHYHAQGEQNHGRGQANEGKERRMPVKEVPSLALLVHQLIRLTQEVGFLEAEPT